MALTYARLSWVALVSHVQPTQHIWCKALASPPREVSSCFIIKPGKIDGFYVRDQCGQSLRDI